MKKPMILVVDDDNGHRLMLEALLATWGYAVVAAKDGLEAVSRIEAAPYDAVLMDIRMPNMDGLTALKAIKTHNPAVPVVIMTAFSAVDSAVEALKSGAYDYLTKPLDFDILKMTLTRTLDHSRLADENRKLKSKNRESPIVGNSPGTRRMEEMIAMVAPSESTVLITGGSGTGKELVASSIHAQSLRRDGPWVAVNCAALSENLLESELFGHEKGAFTGADKRRDGRFWQANKGTLFLDEIGELSMPMQVKLLRAIQQREIQRVGSDQTLPVDVRIVAATNRDLPGEIKAGRFREDLFYRLNVVNIHVPGLAERQEDIPLLAQHFLHIYAERNHKNVEGFSPQAMDTLIKYDWPGNVRELENVIERAVVLMPGKYITETELPEALRPASWQNREFSDQKTEPASEEAGSEPKTLEEVERDAILRTLKHARDNKSEAARLLGISRKTLHTKLKGFS